MADIKSFQNAVAYIESFIFSISKPPEYYRTLERTRDLLNKIGNPQNNYPIIHIGGTSGKGSTSHITAAILQAAGYKVGLHTSPHLQTVTERFMINRQLMPESIFVKYVNQLKPILEQIILESPENPPTYFEILTCLAFLYFANEKVDYAVFEVGMGGKLDSTNICMSKVAVLTNVGLDHTQILGDTVEKITIEKMQIIKPNIKAVTGATQKTVLQLIKEHAKQSNTQLSILNQDFRVDSYQADDLSGGSFNYVSPLLTINNLKISLPGSFQTDNAALAIRAVQQLNNPKIHEHNIREAFGNIAIPGRIEMVSVFGKTLILDGAHNPMKMQGVVQAIKAQFPKEKFPVIFCAKHDKDMSAMLKELLPITSQFIITSFSKITDLGYNVMATTDQIYNAIRQSNQDIPVIKVEFNQLLENLKNINSDKLFVTGSLYFVGAVIDLLHLPWNSRI